VELRAVQDPGELSQRDPFGHFRPSGSQAKIVDIAILVRHGHQW
jgi:hypothetical protein